MRISTWALIALTSAVGPAWGAARHTVAQKDTLWDLSRSYYGTHFNWRIIAEANAEAVKDPHWIYPGQVLVIPDAAGPEVDLGPAGPEAVEASVPVSRPEPAAAPAPRPAPAEEPQAENAQADDLSVDLPPGMTGQYPSVSRFKFPRGWKEDGAVASFREGKIVAAQGDSVEVRLSGGVRAAVGDRFAVYRRDAVEELDADRDSLYLQKVGVAQVVKDLGGSSYRLLILASGDTIQVGDLLKRAP